MTNRLRPPAMPPRVLAWRIASRSMWPRQKIFLGKDYDFVAVFDCLHDMGDPKGAAAHIRQSLAKDGTWMIVEPFANDELKDNLNPVGRIYTRFQLCCARLPLDLRKWDCALALRRGRHEFGKLWAHQVSAAFGVLRKHLSISSTKLGHQCCRGFSKAKTFLRSRAADISPRQLPFLRCSCLTFIPRALGSRQLAKHRHNTH